MPSTLKNFLVGIGFDLDKKSVDQVGAGIDGVKAKALQLGGVVAGAFGIKALTTDFAVAKDELGKFGEVFGVNANDIQAFGNALRLEGGTLEGFMSQLAQLEQFRAGLAIGDAGFLATAGRAGLDVSGLVNAKNATEGFLELADQFQAMTQQQRLNAAQALGLDEATIRLLSKGREEIQSVVDAQSKMRPITDAMTKSAEEFNEGIKNLSTNIGGFADQISVRLLPVLTDVIKGTNSWLDANRGLLNSGIDTFFESLSTNAVAAAAAIGLISAGITGLATGGALSKLGLGGVGGKVTGLGRLSARAGGVGLAATTGIGIGTAIQKNISTETSDVIGRALTSILAFIGVEEARDVEALRARQGAQPIQIKANLMLDGKVIDTRVINAVGGMANQAIEDLFSTEGGA